MPDNDIFVDEIQDRKRRQKHLVHFTHSSTISALVMLLAAVVAIIIANTALGPRYAALWQTELGLSLGDFSFHMSLEHFVNDFLMAIFFLVVGLEIKYEVTVGELTDIRRAILPILAAVGGVLVPILIFCIFAGGSENAGGWGVPTATDIAFALGILALVGDRLPAGLRVFLSTLAIADDIIAIIVIAIFYGHAPSLIWMLAAAIVFAGLVLLNRFHVYTIRWYLLLGLLLWICIYASGLHATLAGVLLAFTVPARSPIKREGFEQWTKKTLEHAGGNFDDEQPVLAQKDYIDSVDTISKVANYLTPPLSTLEKKIHPISTFFVLPLFALANAGVCLVGQDMGAIVSNTAALGIFFGLVIGKPVGIMVASWICVKTGLSDLPTRVTWPQMLGASILGGVGFTMSIFVTNLAFTDSDTVTAAKAAILAASLVAGLIGYVVLFLQAKKLASADEEAVEG